MPTFLFALVLRSSTALLFSLTGVEIIYAFLPCPDLYIILMSHPAVSRVVILRLLIVVRETVILTHRMVPRHHLFFLFSQFFRQIAVASIALRVQLLLRLSFFICSGLQNKVWIAM